ncbi:hypothetical protein N7466_011233 [Penicillium verhagenii]|uniref:uncharacterized protein n=1 Tax=Penicillium verhagenii TaxID=1562060 RepID=UPI002545AA2B|nr:uncharacterized protein N7466_011233 [Penicillium verhagenii]KAJ5917679.1 hypothetical protein N7466_011233 [Penicillium verhagenii]
MPAYVRGSSHWHGSNNNATPEKLFVPYSDDEGQFMSHRLHSDYTTPFREEYEQEVMAASVTAVNKQTPWVFPHRLLGPDGLSIETPQKCPDYVVISYTWGRWKKPTREFDTPVQGGYWDVPSNTLFSREDLDFAIQNIANGDHAWVDVFCIPQIDSDPLHAQEIGNQSAIFRSASRAAVWLCSGGGDILAEICSWVPEGPTFVDPSTVQFPSFYSMREGTAQSELDESRRRTALIVALAEAVPWTTSLWTLQEAALRLDAIFYHKSGEPILHQYSQKPITVRHLVKTLRYVAEALQNRQSHTEYTEWIQAGGIGRINILNPPTALGINENDVKVWLEAIDAVNTINLHRLESMNANELLLASTHRTCKRPHDRVYGIMGAIGVNVPVDYKMNPSDLMDKFLIELHNTLPAEMQAFHCHRYIRPNIRPWLADEDSVPMGMIRQRIFTPTRPFQMINQLGHLKLNTLIFVSDKGVDELVSRFLGESAVAYFDGPALCQISDGMIVNKSPRWNVDGGPRVLTCLVLRLIHSQRKMALVSLGQLAGLQTLGWQFIYLLLGDIYPSRDLSTLPTQNFRRLAVIMLKEDICADQSVRGEFSFY